MPTRSQSSVEIDRLDCLVDDRDLHLGRRQCSQGGQGDVHDVARPAGDVSHVWPRVQTQARQRIDEQDRFMGRPPSRHSYKTSRLTV